MELENLPEHVIHRIMHLLPYEEAAKFNVLSKSLYSSWLSFPNLNFRYKSLSSSDLSYKTFFNIVQKTLQLRGPYIKGSLHNLSLSFTEYNGPNSLQYPALFDVLLNFAIENNVQEFNFELLIRGDDNSQDIRSYFPVNWNYDSLRPLFSSQFLTVLKLEGVNVPSVDAFITCPKLEELVIKWCEGFQTLNVSSSSPSLKKVEISSCELKAFHILLLEVKSLNSFEYDDELRRRQCVLLHVQFRFCRHLKVFKLIDATAATTITDEFNYGLKKLSLNVRGSTELNDIVIDVPNLLEFSYVCGSQWFPKLITSPKCIANILSLPPYAISNISNMRDFLSVFNHIKTLPILCNKFEDMIFIKPSFELVNSSSRYDIRHLQVASLDNPLPSGPNLIKLLNSLLDLVLKPMIITLYSYRTSTNTPSTLKFKYGKKVDTKNSKVRECCYNNVAMKCWRHYELELEFEGYDESSKDDLNKFFCSEIALLWNLRS